MPQRAHHVARGRLARRRSTAAARARRRARCAPRRSARKRGVEALRQALEGEVVDRDDLRAAAAAPSAGSGWCRTSARLGGARRGAAARPPRRQVEMAPAPARPPRPPRRRGRAAPPPGGPCRPAVPLGPRRAKEVSIRTRIGGRATRVACRVSIVMSPKPGRASAPRSDRAVKKRRCWPSGSKCASKRASAIAVRRHSGARAWSPAGARRGAARAGTPAAGRARRPRARASRCTRRGRTRRGRSGSVPSGSTSARYASGAFLARALERCLGESAPTGRRRARRVRKRPGAAAEVEPLGRPARSCAEQQLAAPRPAPRLRVARRVRPDRLVDAPHREPAHLPASRAARRGSRRARAGERCQPWSNHHSRTASGAP